MELVLVHGAAPVLVPRAEQVDHALRRARQRVAQRPEQVLGHVDLPRPVLIQRREPTLQLLVAELALLAIAHEHAELAKVELAVVVRVRGGAVRGVLAHASLEVFLASAAAHVARLHCHGVCLWIRSHFHGLILVLKIVVAACIFVIIVVIIVLFLFRWRSHRPFPVRHVEPRHKYELCSSACASAQKHTRTAEANVDVSAFPLRVCVLSNNNNNTT